MDLTDIYKNTNPAASFLAGYKVVKARGPINQ